MLGKPEEKECHEDVAHILPLENGPNILVFLETVSEGTNDGSFTTAP
jgi:hypothetical protein